MAIKTITAGPVRVLFDPTDADTGAAVADACVRAIGLASDLWGLAPPKRCRVIVMTSWPRFVFRAVPPTGWPLLVMSLPLLYVRLRRTWRMSEGWTMRWGGRTAIGVKPPRLVEKSDTSIGKLVAIEEEDPAARVRQVTCHELVHAYTAPLRPPSWLDEGMAMNTVDCFMGKPTVKPDSLGLVRDHFPKKAPAAGRKLSRLQPEKIAYHYARGYWIVRYMEETRPGLAGRALAQRGDASALEREIADGLGVKSEDFWPSIDGQVADHFDFAPA